MDHLNHKEWKKYLESEGVYIPEGVYPLLLVEGPDGAGKSTVIEIIMDIMKHTFLLHTSAPVKGSKAEYFNNILLKSLELMKIMNQPFVADRFHIGEAVYGSIFRGYELEYKEIEYELIKLDAKQIYVTASKEVLLERLNKRGDWYIKLEDIDKIVDRYDKEIEKSSFNTYILDTSKNINKEDIRDLIKFIYDIK